MLIIIVHWFLDKTMQVPFKTRSCTSFARICCSCSKNNKFV